MNDDVTDLTSDLRDLAEVAVRPDSIGPFLDRALEALEQTIAFDLATFLELRGRHMVFRRARGPLAHEHLHRLTLRRADAPVLTEILKSRRAGVRQYSGSEDTEDRRLAGAVRHDDAFSRLIVPVIAGDEDVGVLVFDRLGSRRYHAETIEIATIYGLLVGLGLAAARQAARLEDYREALEERNRILVAEISGDTNACRLLEASASKPMRRLVQMSKQVAITDAPVLITGETGTGKEVLARAIHGWSPRADAPFIEVNCAALPESLIESELFGHRKGAFSGATEDRRGRFRLADGGTLLLDEIGELPPAVQIKLLRVLQEGTFEPVGGDATVRADVRIVAATHVDLERAIDDGTFREDLYYRLHVFPLRVPPLRERPDDLPTLAEHILDRVHKQEGRGPWTIDARDLKRLSSYDWPGNVRELVNTLERARIRAPAGGPLNLSDDVVNRPRRRSSRHKEWTTLAENERRYIERVLQHVQGRIYGRGGAAEVLGVPPTTLQSRLAKLGIDKARFKP